MGTFYELQNKVYINGHFEKFVIEMKDLYTNNELPSEKWLTSLIVELNWNDITNYVNIWDNQLGDIGLAFINDIKNKKLINL
jgi:hypothetical protein